MIAWVASSRSGTEEEAPLVPVGAPAETASSSAGAPAEGLTPSERAAELWDAPKPFQRSRPTLPTFEGRGAIRGLVTTVAGVSAPARYTVHVGPSTSLTGRERAETRSLACTETEFTIPDLPLGGYDVWISAPGLNSRRTPVLLTEAAPLPYLVLKLSPMGVLDGYVVRADGGPAQELRVELAERDGAGRLEATTRGDGYYRFEDVPDGEYRIRFGHPHAPLVPERELAFLAPSLRFPKVELPPTADVLLHTTDPTGRRVGEVSLTGFGKPTGRIEVTTDLAGNAWVRNLPPGRYRVRASDAEGRSGQITLRIEDEPGQEFWIAVR